MAVCTQYRSVTDKQADEIAKPCCSLLHAYGRVINYRVTLLLAAYKNIRYIVVKTQ